MKVSGLCVGIRSLQVPVRILSSVSFCLSPRHSSVDCVRHCDSCLFSFTHASGRVVFAEGREFVCILLFSCFRERMISCLLSQQSSGVPSSLSCASKYWTQYSLALSFSSRLFFRLSSTRLPMFPFFFFSIVFLLLLLFLLFVRDSQVCFPFSSCIQPRPVSSFSCLCVSLLPVSGLRAHLTGIRTLYFARLGLRH